MALLRVWVVGSKTRRPLPVADRVLVELSLSEPAYPVTSWWQVSGAWQKNEHVWPNANGGGE